MPCSHTIPHTHTHTHPSTLVLFHVRFAHSFVLLLLLLAGRLCKGCCCMVDESNPCLWTFNRLLGFSNAGPPSTAPKHTHTHTLSLSLSLSLSTSLSTSHTHTTAWLLGQARCGFLWALWWGLQCHRWCPPCSQQCCRPQAQRQVTPSPNKTATWETLNKASPICSHARQRRASVHPLHPVNQRSSKNPVQNNQSLNKPFPHRRLHPHHHRHPHPHHQNKNSSSSNSSNSNSNSNNSTKTVQPLPMLPFHRLRSWPTRSTLTTGSTCAETQWRC